MNEAAEVCRELQIMLRDEDQQKMERGHYGSAQHAKKQCNFDNGWLERQHAGPPEQWGSGGVRPPMKFSVDVPFFADKPSKCALFERSNQKCM